MRAANIVVGVAISFWFAMALSGKEALNSVVAQQVAGYPNSGQISLYVAWPLFVVAALLACAWLCNVLQRWSAALLMVSAAALLAMLPYLMIWRGGV